MIASLKHHIRVWKSERREKTKEQSRSPKWSGVRDAFLKLHGECSACSGKERIQVHHVLPFHLNPGLELDTSNLIALCMGSFECHLRIGHGDDFDHYNPNVTQDAADVKAHPIQRMAIEARAKTFRKK